MQQMSEHFVLLSAPSATCLHWSLALWRCLDQMANLLNNNQLQPVLPCCHHAVVAWLLQPNLVMIIQPLSHLHHVY